MDDRIRKADFSITTGEDSKGFCNTDSPTLETATLLFQMAPGVILPYEYGGVKHEIAGYQGSAWIGTTLMISPVYDIIGSDTVEFLNSICVNDFTKLTKEGLRHAILCNEKGQILTDGVVIKIEEDHYRTYWLNPPIDYYVKNSDLDVRGVDMSGKEYFIQIAGERSLEILENVFEKDLHDIRFATHRKEMLGDKEAEIIRLGMSGNLAYEIHGPMEEFNEVYKKVWEIGLRFGARKLGMHAYNLFNHTEAGFPNIHIHYPLPWFETDDEMTKYMYENPRLSSFNINRILKGSLGDELQQRFVTPYDVGWGALVRFNHEFIGRKALEKIAKNPPRQVVTLEWNAEDVGNVFATQFRPDEEPCESIAEESDFDLLTNSFKGETIYRNDRVLYNGKDIGISTGRIVSYNYNSMISLGFIDPLYAKEGTELTLIWGTPGTRQMDIRVKVARYPYNRDFVRNQNRNVEEIPRYSKN